MKGTLKKMFDHQVFPVLRGNLKGLKLEVSSLLGGSVFIRNYEPDKQEVIRHLLKESDVFFDVGANVGLHSYFVARHFPGCKIFAFEPLPENYAYIAKSIERNGITSITLVPKAAGNINGEAFFQTGSNHSEGKLSEANTGLKVEIVSLDSYCRANGVYPDLVKIDVEGAEAAVLEGAAEMVDHKRPVFVIELHNPEQDRKVAGFLTDRKYAVYRLHERPSPTLVDMLIKVRNLQATWPENDGVWGNIVAIPTERLADFDLEPK